MSRRIGISRRDFVRGRFWKLLTEPTPDPISGGVGRRRRLVMRYPRTAEDVGLPETTSPPPTSNSLPPPTRPAGSRVPESQGAQSRELELQGPESRMEVPPSPKSAINLTAITCRSPSPSRAVGSIPIHRPPGAIDEASFLAGCTRCQECLRVCPHDAITTAPESMREGAGTPMIDANQSPCLMCEETPCITACQPGVLTDRVPHVMGTARITEQTCLAYQGTTCSVCREQCPVKGAIEQREGKPTIIEHRCTGCGVCRYVCPSPENAILLMPMFSRPPKPIDGFIVAPVKAWRQ